MCVYVLLFFKFKASLGFDQDERPNNVHQSTLIVPKSKGDDAMYAWNRDYDNSSNLPHLTFGQKHSFSEEKQSCLDGSGTDETRDKLYWKSILLDSSSWDELETYVNESKEKKITRKRNIQI